jgi:hypothetical protein
MDEKLKLAKTANSEKFFAELEKLIADHNMSYMDAVVHYCEKNDQEIEVVASMIKNNPKVKLALQTEGEALNFLPKTAKLPI